MWSTAKEKRRLDQPKRMIYLLIHVLIVSANLRVYKDTTSRRNKQPLHPSTLLADIEGETALIVELPPPDQPLFEQRGVIRKRFEEWFASDMLISTPKRIKLDDAEEDIDDDDDDDDDDHVSSDNSARADTEAKDQDEVAFAQQIRYFDMADFPPLVSSADRFKRVMVREAYDVIFNGVVEHVQHCLENQCAGRVVVTGNPGVGKSRFYLYCAFQLIKAQLEVVRSLPPFELVLNCEECYFLYEADQQACRYLEENEIVKLSFQKNVLRLIDGSSNKLEHWCGVSVLISSSKDATKCQDFCPTFILPVWTLEELKEYNALLPADLMLQEEELVARFHKFGGIAKCIFARNQAPEDMLQMSAIAFFDALTVVKYAQTHRVVTDEDDIHRILKMVPCSDSLRDGSYLTFVSDYVGEHLIDKAEGDDLVKLSALAVT
ncbi:hypothetical protein GN958_ATG20476 [Phytophthora infestans]|uniref:Crinkler (CRN) family protein n=1 Tax=Phytophthora infestans TaxID=4787 RepID=A0A8S9TS76_PHYIN|nr:hypothetical protein GN958_ATG20476 [Phytophthora infestans]